MDDGLLPRRHLQVTMSYIGNYKVCSDRGVFAPPSGTKNSDQLALRRVASGPNSKINLSPFPLAHSEQHSHPVQRIQPAWEKGFFSLEVSSFLPFFLSLFPPSFPPISVLRPVRCP